MGTEWAPVAIAYCVNCTCLVSESNSTPLSSVLSKDMPCTEKLETVKQLGSEQLLGSEATILEALGAVCDVEFLDMSTFTDVLCSRCEQCVKKMLKSFQVLTRYTNKHSHKLFQILKSRSEQLVVRITERQKAERDFAESVDSISAGFNDDGCSVVGVTVEISAAPQSPPPPKKNNKKKVYKKRRQKGLKKLSDEEKRRIRIQNLMNNKPKHKRAAFLKLLANPLQEPKTPRRQFVKELTLVKEAEAFTKSLTHKQSLIKRIENTLHPEMNSLAPKTMTPSTIRRYEKQLIPKELVIRIPRVDIYGVGSYDILQTKVKEESPADYDYMEYEKEEFKHCSVERRDFDYAVPDFESKDIEYKAPDEGRHPKATSQMKYWCLEGECERGFARGGAYAKHIEVYHHKPRPFVCGFCVEVFALKAHLLEHMKIHKGDAESPCCNVQGCGKVFISMKQLKIHNFTVHEEKKFACAKCPMVFAYNRRLVNHETVVHPDGTLERPFTCDHCQLSFPLKHYLVKHKTRVHGTTEKRFECSICTKRFQFKKHLLRHKETHSNETLFECEYCEKVFGTLSQKTQHEKSHQNLREYVCHSCGKYFNLMNHLSNHFVTVHQMDRKEANLVAGHRDNKKQQGQEVKSFDTRTSTLFINSPHMSSSL